MNLRPHAEKAYNATVYYSMERCFCTRKNVTRQSAGLRLCSGAQKSQTCMHAWERKSLLIYAFLLRSLPPSRIIAQAELPAVRKSPQAALNRPSAARSRQAPRSSASMRSSRGKGRSAAPSTPRSLFPHTDIQYHRALPVDLLLKHMANDEFIMPAICPFGIGQYHQQPSVGKLSFVTGTPSCVCNVTSYSLASSFFMFSLLSVFSLSKTYSSNWATSYSQGYAECFPAPFPSFPLQQSDISLFVKVKIDAKIELIIYRAFLLRLIENTAEIARPEILMLWPIVCNRQLIGAGCLHKLLAASGNSLNHS